MCCGCLAITCRQFPMPLKFNNDCHAEFVSASYFLRQCCKSKALKLVQADIDLGETDV